MPELKQPDAGRVLTHGGSNLIVDALPDEQLVAERMVLDGGGALIDASVATADTVRRPGQERGPVRSTALSSTTPSSSQVGRFRPGGRGRSGPFPVLAEAPL